MEIRTDLLYMHALDRAYEREFDAHVIMAGPDHVVLDRTLFYPQGGGQDWDTGTLIGPDGRPRRVGEVTKRGPVKHVVGQGHGLRAGDRVRGTLDWERRFAHMRMHTAQHLVSGLAYELLGGVRTVGNQLHADRSRIDFQPVDFTSTMLKDLESAANDAIRAGHAVTATTLTRDDVNARMPADRTNMDLLPRSVNDLRVIVIGNDVDLCPCAGTHVANTREIEGIEILGKESKGKGTQRVTYRLLDPSG